MRTFVLVSLAATAIRCSGSEEASPGAIADTAITDSSAPEPAPPFTIVGDGDNVGVAVIDITPEIKETYTDKNGNGLFDGCKDDPTGTKDGCDEPFDDKNGDGVFQPVFMAGYDPMRPALGVHDPIECRAVVLARGTQYLAIVTLDVVGMTATRILAAKAMLAKKGWPPERVIVTSSHNHEGPDVLGYWGSPEVGNIWNGTDPEYNALISQKIAEAVEQAAAAVAPATIRMGAVRMRDRSSWYSGRHFGGKNPVDKLHGFIKDNRDPVVVSDQVFVLHARGEDGKGLATLVSWSGHAEVTGDKNTLLSADYPFYLRSRVEEKLGGKALYLPECVGGMQSTLGAEVPLIDETGAWIYQKDDAGNDQVDADGDAVPEWAPKDTFDYTRSVGFHLADAVIDIANDHSEAATFEPFLVRTAPLHVPVDNGAFQLLFKLGLFDFDDKDVLKDAIGCPEFADGGSLHPGCTPDLTWRVTLGPAELVTAPGEVLPEIFWGFPDDDPRWKAEAEDPKQRGSGNGRDSAYFPQHDPDCDAVPYSQCVDAYSVGACDCLSYHALPYRLGPDDAPIAPISTMLKGKYRFTIGLAGDFLGYVVPEPDFNRKVSPLEGEDGDHYEDTLSATYRFASKLLRAQQSIGE